MAALGLLTGLAALTASATASASTIAVDGAGTLRFTAAPGEVNHVSATDLTVPGFMVVTDSGSVITAGAGCTSASPHEARCVSPPADIQPLVIVLRDGDDSATAFKIAFGSIEIDGGTGRDTIDDAPQSGAIVDGGAGGDTINVHPNFGGHVDVHGGGGDDDIRASGATGSVAGDSGDDTIRLVTFVNPGLGPTGSTVTGGPGDDTITADGFSLFELADGGPGADTIVSLPGAIILRAVGGPGPDTITASATTPSATAIDAGAGPDTVDGGGGGDTIDCGPGRDRYVVYAGDTVTNCEFAFTPGMQGMSDDDDPGRHAKPGDQGDRGDRYGDDG